MNIAQDFDCIIYDYLLCKSNCLLVYNLFSYIADPSFNRTY